MFNVIANTELPRLRTEVTQLWLWKASLNFTEFFRYVNEDKHSNLFSPRHREAGG